MYHRESDEIASRVEELESIRAKLTKLGITVPVPTKLFSNNQDATFVANFVREKTENVRVMVKHIPERHNKRRTF